MLKKTVRFLSILTIVGLFLLLMASQGASSRVASAQSDDIPQPLPGGCIGVGPLDDPDACCAFGYVYFNDEPIAGATVRIESADDTWEGTTANYGFSDAPHYRVDLTTDLQVTPGDVITITVSHNDMVSMRTWTVQPDSQQVDMGLLEGYQATEPLSVNSALDPPLKAEAPGYRAVLAGASAEDEAGQMVADVSNLSYSNLQPSGRGNLEQAATTSGPMAIYVKHDASGANNGTSWADAYTDLQDALAAAQEGDEIWVAAGTYKPTEQPDDPRSATFQLINGVSVYGGFAGSESSRDERDWEANPTILSGDLNGNDDDGGSSSRSDNSGHVVTSNGVDSSAILDGFTITGGYAWYGYVHGGGLYNLDGTPTIRHLIFSGNEAIGYGGGMYNTSNDLILAHVTFIDNQAHLGGGLYNSGSGLVLEDALFSSNLAHEEGHGGGMYNTGANITVENVTFDDNTASERGGGMFNNAPAIMNNVSFLNNGASLSGGGLHHETDDAQNSRLTHLTFINNGSTEGGGMYNLGDSALTGAIFKGNRASSGGGLRNKGSSTIANVIFSGNHAYYGSGVYYREAGMTISQATFSGHVGQGSAISYGGAYLTVTNSIFWNNSGSTLFDGASGSRNVSYSLVQGGLAGTGNIDTDPLFVSPINPDDAPTTAGDFHLQPTSPAIDAGDNSGVPPDTTDLDGDGDTSEAMPLDLDGQSRFSDSPLPDTGNGTSPIVDMGAYETEVCYTLTTSVAGIGTISRIPTPNCADDNYLAGTTVTLIANPVPGYAMDYWSGDASGYGISTTVTMDGDKSVTAHFHRGCYHLTSTSEPIEGGTISVSESPTCQGDKYYKGRSVTLTANPNAGYTFSHWSGSESGSTNPITVEMYTNESITAHFSLLPAAAFSASPISGTAPLNVTFMDQSSGDMTSWTWDFGNGSFSGARYPAHTYTLSGTYTVSLTISGPDGSDSETKVDYIAVSEPIEVDTLILTNRQKVAALHGEAAATQLMDKLDELAAHERVKGLVIAVENEPNVAAAYAAWDGNPTSTDNANAVTSAIKGVIEANLASYADIEYIVVAGDDRVIPFRRVLDQTEYSESRYCNKVSSDSVTGAALCDDMTLTDDYYANRMPFVPRSYTWDGHDLYLPDLAIGRLIETPAEMMSQIDAFLADDGIVVSDAVVTGYTFVTDVAEESCDLLNDAGVTTDCSLIGQTWNKNDFISQVLDSPHDLISINGHADHYRIGAPNGPDVTSHNIANASAIDQGAVFYTIACHAGLNVPPDSPHPLDTAQALAQKQANYVANTGYGYGLYYSVGLSEQLMLDFTKELTNNRQTTLGQALVDAKQEYYLRGTQFSYYDEKTLIQSTLYGLPMYQVSSGSSRQATSEAARAEELPEGVIVEELPIGLDGGFSKTELRFELPPLTEETTPDGTYYSLGGLIHSKHDQPVQPRLPFDVSLPDTNAHGVVFTGAVYTDITPFDPVIDQPFTLTLPSAVLAEPPFTTTNWHPAILPQLNTLNNGADAHLTALLGQYNSTIAGGSERLYSELSVDLYYHTASDDWTEPTIHDINSELVANTATVTVAVSDTSAIHTVVVAYTDGNGRWSSSELTASEDVWTGSFPANSETEFFVQAVDQAGNVAVDDNDGNYYLAQESNIGTVILALAPQSVTTGLGETFDLTIEVQAGTQEVDGVAAYLNFDPAQLEVVSITPGSEFSAVILNQFDNDSGQLDFAAGNLIAPFPSGTFTLATVTVRTTALTTEDGTPIEFNSSLPRLSNSTFDGTSVLERTIDNTIFVEKQVILALSPPTLTTNVGQTFDLPILVQAGTQGVDEASAELNFEPTLLEVVSITPGSDLPNVLANSFDNDSGQLAFAADSPSALSGTFTLATVTFKATNATDGTDIDFAPASDATFDGTSVLKSSSGNTVTILNTVLTGSVTLQGRPSPPDSRWIVPLQVSLTIPGEELPAYSFEPTTDESGTFTITSGITPGSYEVRVKHSHTLQNKQTVTLVGGDNGIIDFGTLREGDANDDNYVTLLDFSILVSTFAKCESNTDYDERADFNDDSCVTLLDFSLLASNFATAGQRRPVTPAEKATLVIDTPLVSAQAGELLVVTVQIEAEGGIDGAAAYIDFDSSALRVNSLTAGDTFSLVLQETFDNNTGTINFAAGTLNDMPTDTSELVQIEFEALADVQKSPLCFQFDAPRTSDITADGQSVLSGYQDGTENSPTAVTIGKISTETTTNLPQAALALLALAGLAGAFVSQRRQS